MKKCEIYRQERDKGLSYNEIAEKYKVSKQAVAQACGRHQPARFTPVNEKNCPYVGLREWINSNKVTLKELTRRLDIEAFPVNTARVRNFISGTKNPRKPFIDKLISVTGLSYERLFETGTNHYRSTADIVKEKHGEWEVWVDEYEICTSEFVCSACKESFVSSEMTDKQFLEMMKYCPHCGARMEGDE